MRPPTTRTPCALVLLCLLVACGQSSTKADATSTDTSSMDVASRDSTSGDALRDAEPTDPMLTDSCECANGETETRTTPACGEEARMCVDCRWGTWSSTRPDVEDPDCRIGDARYDPDNPGRHRRDCSGRLDGLIQYEVCSSSCRWEGEYSDCGGGCSGARRTSPEDAEELCMPGGEFMIGCEEELDDRGRARTCFPRHPVRLSSFYIDRYTVTVRRYQECVAAGACTELVPREHTFGREVYAFDDLEFDEPELAVYTASRDQGQAFCEWDGGSLPTGAQWERSAQGVWPDVRLPWESSGMVFPWAAHGAAIPFPPRDPMFTYKASGVELNSVGLGMLFHFFEWTGDSSAVPYPEGPESVSDPSYPGPDSSEIRGGTIGTLYQAEDVAARDATLDHVREGVRWDNRSHASFRCVRAPVGAREGGPR